MSIVDLNKTLFNRLSPSEQRQVTEIKEEIAAHLRERLDKEPDPAARESLGAKATETLLQAEYTLCTTQNILRHWGVMPEDLSVMERFPGVDQAGKYSILDVQAAERKMRIRIALQSRDPEVTQYVEKLQNLPIPQALEENLTSASKKHRLLTRSAKLCSSPDARTELLFAADKLKASHLVVPYSMFLTGLEYISGARPGVMPAEIKDYFQDELCIKLDEALIAKAWEATPLPDKFVVEFESIDNREVQRLFADPANWDKPPQDVVPIAEAEIDVLVHSYARGTTKRLLESVFSKDSMPLDCDITPADLIIIDGKTARERIYDRYLSRSGDPAKFDDYYRRNHEELTCDIVAAALMVEKRVEAFVPKGGKIEAKPVQVTRTGYEPQVLSPVMMNAWERFWSKHGFYKEKVSQLDEYQRMMHAREQVMNVVKSEGVLNEKPLEAQPMQKAAPEKAPGGRTL